MCNKNEPRVKIKLNLIIYISLINRYALILSKIFIYMKNLFLSLSAIAMIAFTSCEKKEAIATTDSKEVAEASTEATIYNIDTKTSNVEWRGFKIYEAENKEEGHNGVMKLASGSVSTEGDKVVAGDFVIDVNTFESLDLNDDAEMKAKLDAHLKNPDFLDVEKYPTATFKITEVKATEGDFNSEVSGNFKMRDAEKNITFKANITTEGDVLTIASEEFTINRKDFGITFEGGHGAVIKDNVVIKVNLTANKGENTVKATKEEQAAH